MSLLNKNAFLTLDGAEDDDIDALASRLAVKAQAKAKADAEAAVVAAEAAEKARRLRNPEPESDHDGLERSNRNGYGQANNGRDNYRQNNRNNGSYRQNNLNGRDNGNRQASVRDNGSGQPNGRDNGSSQPRSNNGYYQDNGQKNGSRRNNEQGNGNSRVASFNDRSNGQQPNNRRVDNVANGNKQVPFNGDGSQRRRRPSGDRRQFAKQNHSNGGEVGGDSAEGWETANRKGKNQRDRSLSVSSIEKKEQQSDENVVEVAVSGEGDVDVATVDVATVEVQSEPEKVEKVLTSGEIAALANREARWKVWLEGERVLTLQEYEKERKWENDSERKKNEADKRGITVEELEVLEKEMKQKKKLAEESRLRKRWEDLEARNEKKYNGGQDDKNDQAKSTVQRREFTDGPRLYERNGGQRRDERNRNGGNNGRGDGNKGRGDGNKGGEGNASLKKNRTPVPPSVTDLNQFPALGGSVPIRLEQPSV